MQGLAAARRRRTRGQHAGRRAGGGLCHAIRHRLAAIHRLGQAFHGLPHVPHRHCGRATGAAQPFRALPDVGRALRFMALGATPFADHSGRRLRFAVCFHHVADRLAHRFGLCFNAGRVAADLPAAGRTRKPAHRLGIGRGRTHRPDLPIHGRTRAGLVHPNRITAKCGGTHARRATGRLGTRLRMAQSMADFLAGTLAGQRLGQLSAVRLSGKRVPERLPSL